MKLTLRFLFTLLFLTAVAAVAGNEKGKTHRESTGCNLAKLLVELPAGHVGSRERADLLFMREEEKLARDIYLSLYETWELRVFRKIARSERKHMALVELLIDKYGLEDPVGDNGLGVFTDSGLQALYEDLAAMGADSEESALLVGAAIEDKDLDDLQRSLGRTDNDDLALLYQNLMRGSRNHLCAFTAQLERREVIYEPIYLSAEEYQEVIDSPRERGVVGLDGGTGCGPGRW